MSWRCWEFLSPHMSNLSQDQHPEPKRYTCYNQWTCTNTSLSPRVHWKLSFRYFQLSICICGYFYTSIHFYTCFPIFSSKEKVTLKKKNLRGLKTSLVFGERQLVGEEVGIYPQVCCDPKQSSLPWVRKWTEIFRTYSEKLHNSDKLHNLSLSFLLCKMGMIILTSECWH